MSNEIENEFEFREAIIKVIVFFNLFDYALTNLEIWLMLNIKCQLREVVEALKNLKQIENKNGFYFLSGREKNIKERLNRYNFTDRKFKRARLAAKIFRFIPWIKMIAVGNLIGAHNLKDDSDLDFFIVAEHKRIWLTRFFCAGLAKFLGWRPQANNSRDKICLSFYVSEQAMDLSGLALKFFPPSFNKAGEVIDIYFVYWLAWLAPLYDTGGVYEKLVKANARLLAGLPNWRLIEPVRRRQVKPVLSEFYHDLIDLLIGGLEPQFKALQLRLLPPRLKNLMNQDNRVVINDQTIKLHANDRREEYREKYLDKINKFVIDKDDL